MPYLCYQCIKTLFVCSCVKRQAPQKAQKFIAVLRRFSFIEVSVRDISCCALLKMGKNHPKLKSSMCTNNVDSQGQWSYLSVKHEVHL